MKASIALTTLIGLLKAKQLFNNLSELDVKNPFLKGQDCETEECCTENLGDWTPFYDESGDSYCDTCLSRGGIWGIDMDGVYVCYTEFD